MDPGQTGHLGAVVSLTVEIPETELVTIQLHYLEDLTVLENQQRRAKSFAMEINAVQVNFQILFLLKFLS